MAAVLAAAAVPSFAGFAGTDIYLPSVGSAMGLAPWYTTVWVYNPNTSPANVTFYLLKRQPNPSPVSFSDTIPPGDVKRYDDAVQLMFAETTFGALRIVSNQKVLVSSRIYAQAQGAGERDSKGQFFAGVPASFAIGPGEKTRVVGVRQTSADKNVSDFRFNVGVVETTGQNCTVTLRLLDETGAQVGASKTWALGPREQRQDNVWSLFGTAMANHQVEVEVTGGAGKVIAFGSSIANGSDDPSTVEMHYADSLLAENSGGGSGTITGVTAGQGLTGGGTSGNVTLHVGAGAGIAVDADTVSIAPGGVTASMLAPNSVDSSKIADGSVQTVDLANGSVTAAKISGSGANNGQVLKFNGSAVVWANDEQGGLTLPYSGSTNSNNPALKVTNAGSGEGLRGESTTGYGVYGYTSGGATGVYGQSDTQNGTGVYGVANNGTSAWGVGGTSSSGVGVLGSSSSGRGVYGASTSGTGVYGYTSGGPNGVYGKSDKLNGTGVYGVADNGTSAWGVGGYSSSGKGVYGSSISGSAGYFYGNVNVTGTLTKGGGSFKIDHPLDPEHKYLYHSFVESPDVKNIYDGVVVTDEEGRAVVELPEWFEALNKDFRYQLTVIGRFAQAIVEEEIHNNRFVIRTNMAKVKVSWQVTGIRKDPFAEAHRIPVEEVKPPEEQGTYLHPKEWGQPEDQGKDYREMVEFKKLVSLHDNETTPTP